MKTVHLFFMSLLLSLFFSCSDTEEIQIKELTDAKKIAAIQEMGIIGIPFPENSKVAKINSETSEIELPDDVFYIAKIISGDHDGDIIQISTLRVTCACNKGGCSPVLHNGQYYCVINSSCSVCSMSTGTSKTNEPIKILGVIDSRDSVKFYGKQNGKFTITDNKKTKYPIGEGFFKSDLVKKELSNLYSLIYGEEIPKFITDNSDEIPSNYLYAKVNFFGNDLMVPIPKSYSSADGVELETSELSKISCSCGKGKGCTLKSIMGTKYCDAGNCSVCSLNDNPN